MIEGYVGPPGSGKTYTLVQRVLEERERYPDRPIFANFPVRGTVYFEPDDWIYLPSGLVILDEAHLLFSSRAALRLPGKWLEVLSQTRKRGWDILWSTQHERRVDGVLRDITDKMWLSCAWGGGRGVPPWFFQSKCYEPELFRKKDKQIMTKWNRFNPKVASAYDTHGRITVAHHLQTEDPKR